MAYSYDFKDNVVYGAEDINGIRASMLTKGVVEETLTSCKAELNEDKVKVYEGQAVFTDGSRIKIDADGVELEYIAGSKSYVFLLNNTLAGVCEVKAGETLPDDDYILIAEIDEEGNLSDKRKFAQLKTADAERFAASFSAEFEMTDDMAENDIVGIITLPKSNCSLIQLYINLASSAYIHVNFLPKENIYITNYENGQFFIEETMRLYANAKYRTFKCEVSGDQLIIRFISATTVDSVVRKISIAGICQR